MNEQVITMDTASVNDKTAVSYIDRQNNITDIRVGYVKYNKDTKTWILLDKHNKVVHVDIDIKLLYKSINVCVRLVDACGDDVVLDKYIQLLETYGSIIFIDSKYMYHMYIDSYIDTGAVVKYDAYDIKHKYTDMDELEDEIMDGGEFEGSLKDGILFAAA